MKRPRSLSAVILAFGCSLICTFALAIEPDNLSNKRRFLLVSEHSPVCKDFLIMLNAPTNADYEIGQELSIPQAYERRYMRPVWKVLPKEEWVEHLHSSEIPYFNKNSITVEIAEFHMNQLPGPNAQMVLRWDGARGEKRSNWGYKISAKTYLANAAYLSFNRMPPSSHADIILQYPESIEVVEGLAAKTYLLASNTAGNISKAVSLYHPFIGNGSVIAKEENKGNIWPQIFGLTEICTFTLLYPSIK